MHSTYRMRIIEIVLIRPMASVSWVVRFHHVASSQREAVVVFDHSPEPEIEDVLFMGGMAIHVEVVQKYKGLFEP